MVVVDDVVGRSFVVNSDQIYYLRRVPSGFALRSLALATRKDAQITTMTKSLYPGLSVSPDGKYALYTQFDRTASNLMLLADFH